MLKGEGDGPKLILILDGRPYGTPVLGEAVPQGLLPHPRRLDTE